MQLSVLEQGGDRGKGDFVTGGDVNGGQTCARHVICGIRVRAARSSSCRLRPFRICSVIKALFNGAEHTVCGLSCQIYPLTETGVVNNGPYVQRQQLPAYPTASPSVLSNPLASFQINQTHQQHLG